MIARISRIASACTAVALLAACSDSNDPLAPAGAAAAGPQRSVSSAAGTAALVVGQTLQLSTTLAGVTAGGTAALTNAGAGGCLTVAGHARAAYTPLTLSACAGSASQTWSLPASGARGLVKVYADAATLCMDDWGARGLVGDRIGTWHCAAGAPTQTWDLSPAGEWRMSNGLCVDAVAAGAGVVTLQVCNGSDGQRWTQAGGVASVVTWTSSDPSVATVSSSGLVTGVAPGAVTVTASAGGTTEAVSLAVTAAQTWAGGTASLTNVASGRCLAVQDDRTERQVAVVTTTCSGTAAGQRWTVAAVNTPALVSVPAGDRCLDNWGARAQAGDLIGTWTCTPGAATQTWTLTSAGELKLSNGLCVQAASSGAQATSERCTGSASQRWTAGTAAAAAPIVGAPSNPAVAEVTPELPRASVDTRMPTVTGRRIVVPAGGDLQAAMYGAQPGDEIILANGATYAGNFEIPSRSADNWNGAFITVRPASMTGLPVEGERVSPARHAAAMPKLVSPNGMFALSTPDYGGLSSRGWRFVGVEIASSVSGTVAQAIVQLGSGVETTARQLSSHLVLDRVWIHGRAHQLVQRCLSLNSATSAVIDSYLSDCHTRGGEASVIQSWGSPGPLKIVNNYLEGGTIGMLVGGADPRVPGLVPSDIEVRRNHFFKPLGHRGVWTVKNAFELKNAQRVLVEGNVFENNWMDAQDGHMILFTPLSQDNLAPWTTVRDVTFRYNVLRNSRAGFSISARNAYSYGGNPAVPLSDVAKRIVVSDNVFDRVGAPNSRLFTVISEVEDLTIAHNSGAPDITTFYLTGNPGDPATKRLVIRDNLFGRGYAMIGGDGTGEGFSALARYGPDATVAGNLVYATHQPGSGSVSQYPGSNVFSADGAAAGVTSATVAGALVPGATLTAGSPYRASGTGGSTPGADLARVNQLTAGVIQP